jgi:hypothetical protein
VPSYVTLLACVWLSKASVSPNHLDRGVTADYWQKAKDASVLCTESDCSFTILKVFYEMKSIVSEGF